MPDLNFLAILVSAIAAMIIGALWYDVLFGRVWMKGMGFDPDNKELTEKMKASAKPAYLQQFVGSLLTAWVMAHVVWAFSLASSFFTGVLGGIQNGLWIWLGFVLPLKYGDKLWGGKKFKYIAVDLGNSLVTLITMGVILSTWK